MKRILLGLFLFFFFGVGTAMAIGYTHLAPKGYVNDFANLLSANDRALIEEQLVRLEKATTAEVAVVTVNNMNGTYIEDYAVKLFEDWKIGKAFPKDPYDNGLLFLIVKDDKQVRIEVGYWLEQYMTDGRAGSILDTNVLPSFSSSDYTNGIKNGVNAIITTLGGTP